MGFISKYFWIFLLQTSLSATILECDWIDPPLEDYREILARSGDEIAELNRLVSLYHQLAKDEKETLAARIDLLNEICEHLALIHKMEAYQGIKGAILLLDKMVVKKRNYLKALTSLPSSEEAQDYHLDFSQAIDACYTPLVLRNNGSYSLRMREYWGLFWLESIDPCHRRLASYYRAWQQEGYESCDYLSFFLWLEKSHLPKYVPVVRYFSQEEVESYHILVDGGLLTTKKGPLTTEDGRRNLFVIDLKKELYVAPWGDGIWHTSISSGKPVFAVGVLHAEGGVIKRLNFESGHYLPSLEQYYQAILLLREKNARFSNPLEVIFFEDREKYKIRVNPEEIKSKADLLNQLLDKTKRELVSANEF